MTALFDTVLVANRGEIAVRVFRTLHRLGIRSVAVYSDADVNSRHVRDADTAVRLGPPAARESYLDIDKVIDAALRTGAQAIHPGYGFLSENKAFAAACERAAITFLGPPARAIEIMGDKITAKNAVADFGVPVVPGIARPGLSDAELVAAAPDIGYPMLIKPSAGGGGKGMFVVEEPSRLRDALVSARRTASSAFGDDSLLIERFVLRPRHIEVQVMADSHGNVVHFGERECSLQRRHQKVIEEAPSPLLDAQTRERIGKAACNTARSVDYVGAGTVEFIVSHERPDEFFFMEMNTRLQVEHPVTEMVTGVDLVEWQVRIAAGEKLSLTQADIELRGHAMEARIYAEDPARDFLPTGGRVIDVREPVGEGVRVDSSLLPGSWVTGDYDPMLSKVIAYGADRAEALTRLDRALAHTAVFGVQTNVEFLRYLLSNDRVIAGDLDTALLDDSVAGFAPVPAPDDVLAAGALYRQVRLTRAAGDDQWARPTGWRMGGQTAAVRTEMSSALRSETVLVWGTPGAIKVQVGAGDVMAGDVVLEGRDLIVTLDGVQRKFLVSEIDAHLWITDARGIWHLFEAEKRNVRRSAGPRQADVLSPLPGTVIAVEVASGDDVIEGAPVVVVEAMKMEHTLTAPISGSVEILVSIGAAVAVDQVLARLVPDEPDVVAPEPEAGEEFEESAEQDQVQRLVSE